MDFANDPAFEKFKAGLFKTFIHENKDKLAQPTSAHDLFMGFIHAVRWTEVRDGGLPCCGDRGELPRQ